MHLVLYRVNKLIIAQYVFILGATLILRIKHKHPISNFDPHLVLLIYYIGILSIMYDFSKQFQPNLFYK